MSRERTPPTSKTKSPENKELGRLAPIPEGYTGPGILMTDSMKLPVVIELYLGKKEDDRRNQHYYRVILNLRGVKNRLEGGVSAYYLRARKADIAEYDRKKQAAEEKLRRLTEIHHPTKE